MKKVLAVALVLVLALSCFAACSAQKKIIGTWECTDNDLIGATVVFNEDGTGSISPNVLDIDLGAIGNVIDSIAGIEMTYSVDGKKVTLTTSVEVLGVSLSEKTATYTAAFDGDALTLTAENGKIKNFARKAAE